MGPFESDAVTTVNGSATKGGSITLDALTMVGSNVVVVSGATTRDVKGVATGTDAVGGRGLSDPSLPTPKITSVCDTAVATVRGVGVDIDATVDGIVSVDRLTETAVEFSRSTSAVATADRAGMVAA